MQPSAILASAFDLNTDLIPDRADICGMCGTRGEVIESKRLIKSATADIADTFRYSSYACLPCAACFSESRLLTSNIYADDAGIGLKPMVAQSSATDERPSWRDLVRSLEHGTQTVAVFTSNTKRRLWTSAPSGTVGSAWRVLMVDGHIDRVLTVNHSYLLDVLNLIETLLNTGYSKRAIGTSCLENASLETIAAAISDEKIIAPHRNTDEFLLALFIAQKDN